MKKNKFIVIVGIMIALFTLSIIQCVISSYDSNTNIFEKAEEYPEEPDNYGGVLLSIYL